jgi:predicted ATPase
VNLTAAAGPRRRSGPRRGQPCRGAGCTLEFPHCWASLTDAYRAADRFEGAIAAIAEGLKQARETSARFNEAELCRLKGDVLPARDIPDAEGAEQCFRHAIQIARGQSAKSPELRATMSLSRLLSKQASARMRGASCQMSMPGSPKDSTPADLRDAKILLEELS